MRLFFPFTPFSNPLFQTLLRHFSSNTNLPTLGKVPTKYRPQAIKEAQEVITDYLHTTSALPFSYAEFISKNSVHSLAELMSKVVFSAIYFRKNFQRFLRYNPLHEFGFFYESIGIHYCNINDFLKPNVHFFSDDSIVLNVACTLAGFGFPWNKLGRLYVEEISIFENNPKFLGSKFNGLLAMGFSIEQAVGICLGFPFLLKGEEVGLKGEFDELLDELKRVLIDYDLGDGLIGNVDLWYEVCRKLRFFYDLGVPKRAVGESIGKSSVVFTDYIEKVLAEKLSSFLKFFHGIGFGEHGFTVKLLKDVHGSGGDLHERFDLLLNEGIEFSKLCKMISYIPKILNQETDSLKRKFDFLRQEVGSSGDHFRPLSLEDLQMLTKLLYSMEFTIYSSCSLHEVSKFGSASAYSVAPSSRPRLVRSTS
uniref:Uncharacterized protein n=1 Tax=Chenopodium quinoa TaxID=63459 RepID=A0A803LS56_CHEQI